eukprot:7381457-Ditylum_brightwellii.AAC.1
MATPVMPAEAVEARTYRRLRVFPRAAEAPLSCEVRPLLASAVLGSSSSWFCVASLGSHSR